MTPVEPAQSAVVRVLDTEVVTMLLTLDENGNLLSQLLQEFRVDAVRFGVEASAGVLRLDAQSICRAAHTLRGSSGTLGMFALATLCLEIEELAQARRFESLGAKLAEFERSLERSLAAVDAFRLGSA